MPLRGWEGPRANTKSGPIIQYLNKFSTVDFIKLEVPCKAGEHSNGNSQLEAEVQ